MAFIPGSTAGIREISDEEFAREVAERERREQEAAAREGESVEVGPVEVGEAARVPAEAVVPTPDTAEASLQRGIEDAAAGRIAQLADYADPQATGEAEHLAPARPPVRVDVETQVWRVRAGDVFVTVEDTGNGWRVRPSLTATDEQRELIFPAGRQDAALEVANRWVRHLAEVSALMVEAADQDWEAWQEAQRAHADVVR